MSNASYYASTAYNSTAPRRLPPADNSRFGLGMRTLRRRMLPNLGSTQCREFIADFNEDGVIQWLNSDTPEVRRALEGPFHQIQYWETLRNPRAVVDVTTKVMLIFAAISWVGFFIAIIGFFTWPGWIFTSNFLMVLAFPSVPTILYLIGKYILKYDFVSDKNNILFNRRKGVVVIPRKKASPLELPFDEFDGYLGSTVNPSGSTDYHLILAHRYSATLVQHPGGGDAPWKVNMELEYLLQYMDTSKPLPDVPRLEPFRSKDPTTAAYDRKHNRPPRYWRDMAPERFKQMHDAAYEAASQYPWGLTRQEALAQGWQPSGVGQGDWRTQPKDDPKSA